MLRLDATIRGAVHRAYSAAARQPDAGHPFPVGRRFAESVGYPTAILDSLPESCVGAFAGVSYVVGFAKISLGDTVLDVGCGAGLDTLIAARRVGPSGRVIGVDFSERMPWALWASWEHSCGYSLADSLSSSGECRAPDPPYLVR